MAVSFATFVLDGERRLLLENSGEVHLSPKAYDLLTALVEQRPRAVSKVELQARLWPDTFVQEANLGVLVSELRSALHDGARRGRFIRTVHGFGYAFAADVIEDRPAQVPALESNRSTEPSHQAFGEIASEYLGKRAGRTFTTLAVVTVAIALGLQWWTATLRPPPASMRLTISLPPDMPLAPAGLVSPAHDRPALALSPDGSQLAYVCLLGNRTGICVRDMRSPKGNTRALEHTEGGHTPFFSPDGDWIGFFADHKLKKIAANGGVPTILADAPYPWGATWGPDNTIYFNRLEGEGIFSVVADGGPVQLVVEGPRTMPELLGRGTLLVSGVRHVDPRNPAATRLLVDGGRARYLASGHLIYASTSTLMAVGFDAARAETTGASVTLAEDVRTATYGVAQFTVSDEGTLVYVPGSPQGMASFVWVERNGSTAAFGLPKGHYSSYALAPDGQRLAFGLAGDIWVYDRVRGTTIKVSPRVARGQAARNLFPRWTPDGQSVIYVSWQGDLPARLVAAPADASADAVDLWTARESGPLYLYPMRFSPDGGSLSVFASSRTNSYDLYVMPGPMKHSPAGNNDPQLFLGTTFGESCGQISPDGRWMLFHSDRSGAYEIYVTSYPKAGAIVQVSKNGGREPMWNPAATEIVYANGLSMYAVAVTLGDQFHAGEPRLLFSGAFPDSPGFGYDMASDGRFLMLENPDILQPTTTLNVITNTFAELDRLLPPAKR